MTDENASTPSPHPVRTAPVRRWLLGLGVSLVGDHVFFIALGWAAIHAADPGMAGAILAAGAVPRALLTLVGGVAADRMGARKILIISDGVRLVAMLAVSAVLTWTTFDIAALFVISITIGVADAFFQPAIGALPPRIVSEDQLLQLQGLRAFTYRAAAIVGAPVGGFLVARSGVVAALLFNAATFAVSLAAIATLRLRAVDTAEESGRTKQSFNQDLVAGLRYAVSNAIVLPTVATVFLIELSLSGTINIGLPLLAERKEWGAGGLGLLVGGFGIGAAVAALASSSIRRLPADQPVFTVGALAGALGTAALPWAPSAWAAAAATSVMGAAAAVMTAVAFALVQTVADVSHLGRVMSLFGLASMGSVPFSSALTGWVAGSSSVATALLCNAGVAVLGAVVGLKARDRSKRQV